MLRHDGWEQTAIVQRSPHVGHGIHLIWAGEPLTITDTSNRCGVEGDNFGDVDGTQGHSWD